MAAFRSLGEGSDEAYDLNCDTCLRETQMHVEALMFCYNCNEYFYSSCFQYNQRFSVSKHHASVAASETRGRVPKGKVISVSIPLMPADSVVPDDVPGMCIAPCNESRYLIISDWKNKSVKVLDAISFSLVNCKKFTEKPYGLQLLQTSGEIAVSFRDSKEIIILKLEDDGSSKGRLIFVRKLQAPEKVRGITAVRALHCDVLYMVRGGDPRYDKNIAGEVHISNYGGVDKDNLFLLKRFSTNYEGRTLFPRNIVINKTGERVFVSDSSVGVVIYNNDGVELGTLSDPRLKQARGLCIDKNDNVYVSGMDSANVMKFSPDGNVVGEILSKDNGLTSPISLFYDNDTSSLFVGSTSHEPLQVFKL